MSALIPIHLAPATFQKVQRLSILAGSETAAIERLIAHWEDSEAPSLQLMSTDKTAATSQWRSPTGDTLRVGERLEARDGGNTHYATVERRGINYDGTIFDSPSAAARAVKEKRGLAGNSASTNGREFWKIRDPSTNRLVPLSALRPFHKVDVDAMFAELEALPSRSDVG
jgi:hypothetical protein